MQNIAFGKPVHVSTGKLYADNITDGREETYWQGEYYPSYIDIDLEENYYLDNIEVCSSELDALEYSVFTSINGRDFEQISTTDIEKGISVVHGKEARVLRIYVEYDAVSPMPKINLVRATGKKSDSPIQKKPSIKVRDFSKSKYNTIITEEDTYHEIYGLIKRRLGEKYKDWFSLELSENPLKDHSYDYFEISCMDGRIHIKGNNGVSIATGLNYYLKYFCNVHISQVGDQVNMPDNIVFFDTVIFKETKAKIRYAYNYCTLSYSMAFWGETEWRNELDWLALNGVNVVLDLTAQEEVWRRFLGSIGYQHEDIKDFIAGPAFYAWAYMSNLSGFGGPVHDSWFETRTELARKNQLIMRKLGMSPVLQGYSGMMPNDIKKHVPDIEVIEQGKWCTFERPHMLKTTSTCFDIYAEKFYKAQCEVYGNITNYYATDPFHEGGRTEGMSPKSIANNVLSAMLRSNPDAVWVIQSWQGNPTSELLAGLEEVEKGKSHALILDLYAEKTPHYDEGSNQNPAYGYEKEFNHTPWVFCMLNNFGGRLGLHGHLDNLLKYVPYVFNHCKDITGIGISPEASGNNPVLYDFFFETIWQNNAEELLEELELDAWLKQYTMRRYGKESIAAQEAWKILSNTVYKAELNNLGQGAPECIANARPALEIKAASAWGNTIISYDKNELEKAKELLLKDYEVLKSSEGYIYDIVTISQQVLSNRAGDYFKKMTEAYRDKDKKSFEEYAQKFIDLIDEMERITSTNQHYSLNKWVAQAENLAFGTDDFTLKLYKFNSKALVTTWGSHNHSEIGRLHDYSNRQWSGLFKDFYKPRWERWILARKNELRGESYEKDINWFEWEWKWART